MTRATLTVGGAIQHSVVCECVSSCRCCGIASSLSNTVCLCHSTARSDRYQHTGSDDDDDDDETNDEESSQEIKKLSACSHRFKVSHLRHTSLSSWSSPFHIIIPQ